MFQIDSIFLVDLQNFQKTKQQHSTQEITQDTSILG